ncbi:hypothetical protein BDQ12DRAFT_727062 [Crucibulum laeve]|uniref:Uncharacterized protein n=1 Tax=Crucibulum laeve TaxID=68775 RepID=A0A5C3LM92_9AGAR|nr:hypothetical protein BDQ12DRAFT_727062 [Crucibulum laeve]
MTFIRLPHSFEIIQNIALYFLHEVNYKSMTTYQLEVQIAPSDIRRLKEGGYNLCIAKKVNGAYSVIWSGDQNFAPSNTFEWVDEYQVFGVDSFKVGALVKAATNSEDIQPGQSCVLDQNGVMGVATGSAHSTGRFSVLNEYSAISIGVSAKLFGETRPVFVTPTSTVGTTTFEPVDDIVVWFSPMLTTGTMISGADITTSIEVKYGGGETSKSVRFSDGNWAQE